MFRTVILFIVLVAMAVVLGNISSAKGVETGDVEFPDYPDSEPIPPTTKGEYSSKGERHMHACLRNIFNVEFVKVRPDWLKNPETGRNLELDAFNAELMIAAEYNGRQHYEWSSFFEKTKEGFEKQIRRDAYKRDICMNNSIYLMTVPYTVKPKNMQRWMYNQLINSETK
jgi:hypothetical protein